MSEDNHSLGARVFHIIRENILSGKYTANEELKEKFEAAAEEASAKNE